MVVQQSAPLLNPRWEKFAQAIFSGVNNYKAAIIAGYTEKSAMPTSSVLIRNPKISARIQALQANSLAKNPAIMLVDERKLRLSEIARHGIEMPISAGQRVAAITELNKMEHVYETPILQDNRVQTMIFLMPDGSRLTPGQLIGRSDAIQRQGTDSGGNEAVQGEGKGDNGRDNG